MYTPTLQHATMEKINCVLHSLDSLPSSLSSLPDHLLSILTTLPHSSQLASEVVAMAVHLSSLLLTHSSFPLFPVFQALHKHLSLHPSPQPFALASPSFLKQCGHLTLPQQAQVSRKHFYVDSLSLFLSPVVSRNIGCYSCYLSDSPFSRELVSSNADIGSISKICRG